ncbi:uncharacterized protein BO97DRAFT_339965 [Aspergillus homomorphus CBS 101889]|uniref:Uncharacterized protein n=1 Tax=Aspergillus homomorphus (strain CBS 101889) TaxID=1450537 RepID=A0A395I697_ASPHC|nr:hypothetical protein BO97DRAFT_339965 [Aspergillus homomorphus CBS 101889]RAL14718.1 hypothetical protein BO97DRAFT_339965 [Aspergillus homomorphus CBS 101889]
MQFTTALLWTAGLYTSVYGQGFADECTDIYLKEGWVVGTCPTSDGTGTITSSVYLPNKITNSEATLEEHIANYDGHLLSNLTGSVTSIPANSSWPVPSDFEVQLQISSLDSNCSSIGGYLTLNDPLDCYYLDVGVEYYWYAATTANNLGWKIVAYHDKTCSGDAVGSFTPDNVDTCLHFPDGVSGFAVLPLWNAD